MNELPENAPGSKGRGRLYSLQELAEETGRPKRTMSYYAKQLPAAVKQKGHRGAVLLTEAGAELLRARALQGTTGQTEQTEQTGQTEQTEQTGQTGQSGEFPGKSGYLRPGKPGKVTGQTEQTRQTGQSDRANRAKLTGQTEQTGQSSPGKDYEQTVQALQARIDEQSKQLAAKDQQLETLLRLLDQQQQLQAAQLKALELREPEHQEPEREPEPGRQRRGLLSRLFHRKRGDV